MIRVFFYGRKIGAIGLSGFQVVDMPKVEPEFILMHLYKTHEHIDPRSIKVVEL